MIKDYFTIALKSLVHRKMRTFLTLIGIFIGIAAVVGLISLSQGFNNYLQDEFKELGADKIMVVPGGSSFGAIDSASPLTMDDFEVIRDSTGVAEASYWQYKVATIEWGKDDVGFYFVWTYPLDETRHLVEQLGTINILEGRRLKDSDRGKAVVGYDYAHYAGFEKNIVLGSKIIVNGEQFKIVGIHEKIGNPSDDRMVLIQEDDYTELFDIDEPELNTIVARVPDGRDPAGVVENIEKDLRRHRGLKVGEEDFEVTTFEELIQAFMTVFAIVGVVLVGIASISLFVGGINIMNTMYTSVIERTKEIGIMKAIGARNKDVLMIFLVEAGFLGMIGGALGVIFGIIFAKTVEYIGAASLGTELLQAAIPWWLVVGALLFAFLLGSFAGSWPARQASKMNPVDALRTE